MKKAIHFASGMLFFITALCMLGMLIYALTHFGLHTEPPEYLKFIAIEILLLLIHAFAFIKFTQQP